MSFQVHTRYRQLLADTVTPVSIYLKLRDKFVNTILLESSDYHGNENSFSYICCQPVAKFEVSGNYIIEQFPDGSSCSTEIKERSQVLTALEAFGKSFQKSEKDKFPFIHNGLFGYMSYPSVQYFEDINLKDTHSIPDIIYQVFRYVIAINHFKDEMFVFEHEYQNKEGKVVYKEEPQESNLNYLISLIQNLNYPSYQFKLQGTERSNLTDEEFLAILEKGRYHCKIGDVFQIVLSRRFEQQFQGDEFNVYRALRSVNPSPYLFYFDYGNFKIFGSSPETQISIKGDTAAIYPIAGTFRRTGNDQADAELAQKLYDDPKENAEHVMLVDLARNDLSRHSHDVTVETFKEIQYYSHVIHLVSKVTGEIEEQTNPLQLVADTFPAGTLSGAPKHKAMQLIDRYEPTSRSFYGGCIGFMDFNGDFNHAIMIRSFLSKDNTLYYQAGAGVVFKSQIESELQEVNNKIAALRRAVQLAGVNLNYDHD
ncbi:anthranilate synthase component I family protein [Cytophagaceae bacterium YF14B1]|uniref:Anthranilate synthase component 1 n=1 Tax=Xanthocytophaga flava TaxID=3048013 RepID=A0AAE3QQU7_9BACT|nr:anthranilate synthase component I family protein [Xanthocytophaga flavus]MDJ1483201.1 anthranilate synthase component I family protein [Xanthocytophaga flavus]